MSIEAELNHIVKNLACDNFPNKQVLQEGYENLKSLLTSHISSELLPEAVKALKANLVYQQFKLADDPQFLKTLIVQVDNAIILDELFALEVDYSKIEEQVLDQQLLLLALDYDLKEVIEFFTETDSEAFEIYLEDLQELKNLFCLEKINPGKVEWFLHSDLFVLMADSSDSFDIPLTDIYQALLDNCKISTAEEFLEHKAILREKAKQAANDKESFELKKFLSILAPIELQLKEKFYSAENKLAFFNVKYPEMASLSPIAKKALLNRLKKYPAPVR
jgi:hypothetical protein